MTYVPNDIYDIFIYDHTGDLLLILQRWSRLEYHQRTNAPWNHQITLEFGYDDPDLATLRGFEPDYMVVIYRTDPVTLVRTMVYEGFNTTVVDQVRANGGVIINLYGVGYTQLLQRRVVVPTTGEEYSTKSGKAETIIKSFVNESMIGTLDANRVFSGMSIASNNGLGEDVTYSARYINLLSVCETIAERGNLDFGIYGGANEGEFIFDARDVWGEDLREDNDEGNIPVIFSIENDNMLIPILSLNHSAEQNYAYVGGEGQGADRVIEEVANTPALTTSPWSRKEFFVESRQQSDESALIAAGKVELEKRKAKQKLTFNIRQTDSSRWIRDWNLGDLISAKYYTYTFDRQISEVSGVVTSGQSAQAYEIITVEMKDLRINV